MGGAISDPVSTNRYDYVGADPINNADPSGMCWTGFCWAEHVANWAAAHVEQIDYAGAVAFCLEGAGLGAELGSAAGPWGTAGGALGGCLVNGLTEVIIVHHAREQILRSGG